MTEVFPSRWILLLALLLTAGFVSTPKADAMHGKRVCGVLPGEGAYSFIKAKNVDCRTARKVSRQAGRRFCGHHYRECDAAPLDPPDKGRVTAKGWNCKMKVGYEFYRAKCRRGDQKFVSESAA